MKQTENYQLSQWEKSDRILMEDFNADNAKIETALTALAAAQGSESARLEASISAVSAAMGSLPGRLEVIQKIPSTGGSSMSSGFGFPSIDWNEWDLVCVLVTYESEPADTPLCVYLINHEGGLVELKPMATPGLLIVFLPFHKGTSKVTGFILSDHLVPITASFTFQDIHQLTFRTMDKSEVSNPDQIYFGRK